MEDDDLTDYERRIVRRTFWCNTLTIKSISDVYGIILMGFGDLNDYYIFQSHGDYLKYTKLAGKSTLTISKNNQGDIFIEYNGVTDINLLAFSGSAIQIIMNN